MTYRLFIYFFFFLASAAVAAPDVEKLLREEGARAAKNADLYYDEIFDRDGKLRPQYQDIYPRILELNQKEKQELRRLTKKDFRGDNALSPVALITDQAEHARKREGVAQRGKALLRFLQDHYSGEKTYLKQGVIPPDVMGRVLERAGEGIFEGQIDPKKIKFLYGPDIIRDAEGIFRVLEDNTNYLGGQGDLVEARESLWRRMPAYPALLGEEKLADPKDFYRELLARYRAEMPDPNAKVVFFSVPPYPDQEDTRLRKIWAELGVEEVTPFSRNPKLVRKADGMYLERLVGPKKVSEKIGYLIFNSEFAGLDTSTSLARQHLLYTDANYWLKEKLTPNQRAKLTTALAPDPKTGKVDFVALEKALTKDLKVKVNSGPQAGILEAITKGLVLTNNTPGTEFINDKEFNTYVEDLVRFYLQEEPILRNLPTRRLYVEENGVRKVDPKVFRELESDFDKYVVKVVDGRGGDGVWVGPKLSKVARKKLLRELKTQVGREVIVQEYRHPSVLAGDIVDERILAQVGPGKMAPYVSEVGWSRGVTMAGNGKVNLSGGKAHEVTVVTRDLTAPKRLDCPSLFRFGLSPR